MWCSPLLAKAKEGGHPMSKDRAETHVSHVSCTLYCEETNFRVAVWFFLIIFSTIQFSELPSCPTVVSRDHAVCLAAEHAERRRSPSTTEIGDAAAEGAKSRMKQPRTEIFLTTAALLICFKSDLANYPSQ